MYLVNHTVKYTLIFVVKLWRFCQSATSVAYVKKIVTCRTPNKCTDHFTVLANSSARQRRQKTKSGPKKVKIGEYVVEDPLQIAYKFNGGQARGGSLLLYGYQQR